MAKAKRTQTPESVLEQIGEGQAPEERLQQFDQEGLRLVCGDGKRAVMVGSKGDLETAAKPLKSRLPKEVAMQAASAEPVEGEGLYSEVRQALKSYLHHKDQKLFAFQSVWIIGTHVYTVFTHYGYLFFHSKTMRCGKTRSLEICHHLAYEAVQPLNAPTPPVIRETASEGGTVLLDTLERWKEKSSESHSAAMEILDAGFRNGGTVAKMVGSEGSWTKCFFPVYAPYLLSGINRRSLSDTALDRSFPVEMKRKPKSAKTKPYNYHKCEEQCSPIRERLYIWALQNADQVSRIYSSDELSKEVESLGLNDRAADIWKPLFALLMALGFERGSKQWADLASIAVQMHRDPEWEEIQEQIAMVSALRSKAVDGRLVGKSSDLAEILKESGIEVSHLFLHIPLEEWGFRQKSIRLESGPRRAWELTTQRLAEIEEELRRLLPSRGLYTPPEATTVTTKQE